MYYDTCHVDTSCHCVLRYMSCRHITSLIIFSPIPMTHLLVAMLVAIQVTMYRQYGSLNNKSYSWCPVYYTSYDNCFSTSPRPPLPMSLIWTEEEAALIIQSHWRGFLVCVVSCPISLKHFQVYCFCKSCNSKLKTSLKNVILRNQCCFGENLLFVVYCKRKNNNKLIVYN